MLFSADEQRRYDDQLDAIAKAAEDAAIRAYDAMREADPSASVADIREACMYIVESVLDVYGGMAAETAAQLYDAMAEASGAKVAPAMIPAVDDETRRAVEKQIRYDVGAFVDGESDE